MSANLYLLSGLFGAQLADIAFLILINLDAKPNAIQTILMFLIFICFSIGACLLIQKRACKKIISDYKNNCDANSFSEKCENVFSHSINNNLKIALAVSLCEAYIKEKEYRKAFSALKKATGKSKLSSVGGNIFLPSNMKLNYFLKLIYLNVTFNNLIDAQIAFEDGQKYINKFRADSAFSAEISRVLALLEYAKGSYSEAGKLISAVESDNSDETAFLKAKIFLKNGDVQRAEKILEEIIYQGKTEEISEAAQDLLNRISCEKKDG